MSYRFEKLAEAAISAKRLLEIELKDHFNPQVAWTLESYKTEFSAPGAWIYSSPSAYILFRLQAAQSQAQEAWIMNIAVETKGKGEGTKILENFLKDLPQLGSVESVGLEVGEKNLAARKLYQNLGFKDLGFRKSYYRSGEGAWVMSYRRD